MVNELNDHYTTFQEPTNAKELTSFLQGQIEGIGASLDLVDKNIVVTETLLNSPAEKSGLKPGDQIIKIDGKDVAGLTLQNAVELIRGVAGTKVNLTIQRSGTTMEFDLTREKLTLVSVAAKLIGNNIGYLKLSQFLMSSNTELQNSLNQIMQQTNNSPKGLIIDLRGNPGGYIDITVKMLGLFIGDSKVLTTTRTANGSQNLYLSTGKGTYGKFPIMVLIDKNSASAAEIMAGALQDYKIGKLVGEKSFGKGSVQELLNYIDGSILKMTIAHWLTPLNRDINGTGLIPDIAVEKTPADQLAGKDTVLERAVEELNKL